MQKRLSVRQVVLCGLMGALMVALKQAMSGLPNIEPVSFLTVLFTLEFPALAPWTIAVFVLLQFLLYGFGLWSWMYLYIWFILYAAVRLLKNMRSPLSWAMLSGAYGLAFGALCTPVYFITQGVGGAVAWWLAGIPADLLHCAGNFTIMLLLYRPVRGALARIKSSANL